MIEEWNAGRQPQKYTPLVSARGDNEALKVYVAQGACLSPRSAAETTHTRPV